jgi:hypothetical protein
VLDFYHTRMKTRGAKAPGVKAPVAAGA